MADAVRTAIYSRLNDSSVVGSGKASAIYADIAPSTSAFPYVIFSGPSGRTENTMGGSVGKSIDSNVWTVKGVSENSLADAETVQACIRSRLDKQTLSISGQNFMALYVETPIAYLETDAGVTYFHRGYTFRLVTQPN